MEKAPVRKGNHNNNNQPNKALILNVVTTTVSPQTSQSNACWNAIIQKQKLNLPL